MRDIARKAGVSEAAVSVVLNGKNASARVSEETRQRIVQAAGELRYHPNALARGLARRHTDTVALLLPYAELFSHRSGFPGEMMQGVTEAAHRLHYDLLLHTNQISSAATDGAALTDGRTDGALLFRHWDDPLIEHLLKQTFPFVLMFVRSRHPQVWWVDCDNVAGGQLATEYLVDLGHTQLLHLTGSNRPHEADADRRIGFEAALRARGIQPRPEWTIDVTWEGGSDEQYQQVRDVLIAPDRPTAAFCWYDGVALRLMRLARELGLRIPEDLSIIGFDATELCTYAVPTLTSVRQPIRAMAGRAMDLLHARLLGETPEQIHVEFTPNLVPGASCAPPAQRRRTRRSP